MRTHLLLGLALLSASGAAQAQAPVGKRLISRSEAALYIWPRFARADVARDDEYNYTGGIWGIQFLLRNQGFHKSNPDSFFGPGTERAVKRFQRAKGLKADGIVGAQTFQRLCVRLRRGDHGDAVRALQHMLCAARGDFRALSLSGVFDAPTEQMLRDFQKHAAIATDGVAGAQSWAALFKARFASF